MQNADAINAGIPEQPKVNYLTNGFTLKSWLLTKDHKRIALMYLISVSLFFLGGGLYASAIRLELLTPASDLMQSATYNKAFTQHGILMIFFFLIPSIPAILGNFLLPLMIGAKDLALPRINLLSLYLYWIGGILTVYALLQGGVDTGWTFYTPYSTTFSNSYVMAVGLGIFINGFSSILTGLNFIVTIHTMRAPGMTWFRLPLFVWAHYATSLVMILGTPVVAITILLVAIERVARVGIFDPAIGGDPILFQHLFWFYSHPAVYIMILPGMGVVSELISNFSRKKIFGYEFIAFSSIAIAVFGFLVWGHHMFVSGQSIYAGLVFSFLTMVVAVPSAIKMFNWTATMYKGSISYDTPMLYAIGFLGLFLIGGLTGLFLGSVGLTVHLTDTYFVVAHFHYVMVGGQVIAYLGGIHYWWPKITGKMYSEFWGKVSAMLVFVGFNLTFFPQFILGYQGMPRRYASYPEELQVLNIFSTAGASVLGVGLIMPVVYLAHSLVKGKAAGDNPWMLPGLEWRTSSPPPTENFEEMPVVTWEAYEFGEESGLDIDGARKRAEVVPAG
ncbi:MAG: cbb3-type cytochrome c oxidase subunit I [Blastocatellia bacterium]|nr:cbb3-type cytochrome c oxidase subunit I [Chloracidobacterium sp.]MBL8186132.1 cbb3-type cytochrome c oxidase subunit I [Blastocatellia bacterium]HRJ88517.1 cbb3-type cytochrome c oxidase subunit I [Pyrinomonadaceae bacterium]HRK50436.1 cbb3-type cytochrome c oxidase subunit I [Pyrinomonadaceae bacterium]